MSLGAARANWKLRSAIEAGASEQLPATRARTPDAEPRMRLHLKSRAWDQSRTTFTASVSVVCQSLKCNVDFDEGTAPAGVTIRDQCVFELPAWIDFGFYFHLRELLGKLSGLFTQQRLRALENRLNAVAVAAFDVKLRDRSLLRLW
jgi:hypothetical protein